MLPVGFEPTNSAGERPQTYPLDRAATGADVRLSMSYIKASEQGSAVTKKHKHPALAGRHGCFRAIP